MRERGFSRPVDDDPTVAEGVYVGSIDIGLVVTFICGLALLFPW